MKAERSKRRDLSAVCEAGRSQSPHSSEAALGLTWDGERRG